MTDENEHNGKFDESGTPSAGNYARQALGSGIEFRDNGITAGGHTISFKGEDPPLPFRFYAPGGAGLLMNLLVEWVERAGPLASGPGQSLWRYASGVWLPDGESEVVRRVRLLLGDRYRKTHAQAVVDVLANRTQFIGRDTDLWGKINVANGILDWRTDHLEPHDPSLPFTWQLPVAWNPEAVSPTFDEWLDEVFPGTTNTRPSTGHRLAYELIGYPLLGRNLLHKSAILHGSGRNGKGTFLRVLTALCGSENTSSVSLQTIASDKYATAELFGKLANVQGDLDGSSIRYTDRLKQITGGDELYAQRKYQHPFKFVAGAFPIFAANELPRPQTDFSEGFFSRFVIVPFSKGYFPEGRANPLLEDELLAELEGVLVKAVAAIRDLVNRRSFTELPEVVSSTKQYRTDADPVLAFIEARMRPVPPAHGAWVPRRELYQAYRIWCDANGGKPLGARNFYPRLSRQYLYMFGKGLAAAKRQTDGYRNVALLDEEATIEPSGSSTIGELRQEWLDAREHDGRNGETGGDPSLLARTGG